MRVPSRHLVPVLVGLALAGCGRNKIGGAVTPVTDPGQVTFRMLQRDVFQPKCQNCHRPEKKKGNIDVSTWTGLVNGVKKSVIPGDHENSLLYQVVLTGEMPFNDTPLDERERKLIADWIKNGAKNN